MSQAELNLDQLLSDMAEDVPPMPDGLHDKWMDSVRAEAAKNENPLPVSVSRWPRILSVAAAFIFLIGGTFIYRSSRKTILPESRPADAVFSPEASVMKEAVTEDADMEEFVAQEAKTEERAMEEDATLAAGAAYETPDYAGEANNADDYSDAGSPARKESFNAVGEKVAMDYAEESAEEETATDVPAAGSSGTASPASSHPESADIGGFFADMGDFLLTVWPYLLIAAVLSAIITGIIKLRKKQ